MTTKDQAIARFVEAVKLDRHDLEDWPTASREAFIALYQSPAPDCRTCENIESCKADAKWLRNAAISGAKHPID